MSKEEFILKTSVEQLKEVLECTIEEGWDKEEFLEATDACISAAEKIWKKAYPLQ